MFISKNHVYLLCIKIWRDHFNYFEHALLISRRSIRLIFRYHVSQMNNLVFLPCVLTNFFTAQLFSKDIQYWKILKITWTAQRKTQRKPTSVAKIDFVATSLNIAQINNLRLMSSTNFMSFLSSITDSLNVKTRYRRIQSNKYTFVIWNLYLYLVFSDHVF